jgi:hypothetical protein
MLLTQFTRATGLPHIVRAAVASPVAVPGALTLSAFSRKDDAYDILWALVFGFATLNILSLVSRRFDPNRQRMSFGEMMALSTVLVAVILLGWEMLNQVHIFPIRLSAH